MKGRNTSTYTLRLPDDFVATVLTPKASRKGLTVHQYIRSLVMKEAGRKHAKTSGYSGPTED